MLTQSLESAVIPSLKLQLEGKEYRVEFPLSAVIVAEEKLGRSLKSLQDWFALKAKDISVVLEAGLLKHHAEEAASVTALIGDRLNPEALDEVQYALCKLAFPRVMARIEEAKTKGKT